MFSYTPVYPQFPEYAAQEDTAANARPVTQTIKTDPATGEQTMTISGSPQDLSAANPLTPTVVNPVSPDQMQTPGFTAPQAPQLPEMPQPGEPMQVAGPAQLPAVAQQFASQPPLGQAPQAAPAAQPQAAEQPAPAAAPPQWAQDLMGSQGNLTKLHAIAGNERYPQEVRDYVSEMTARQARGEYDQKKASETIQRLLAGDPRAQNDVMRDLKKEEGSYIKAYLYNRLGMHELAKQEQEKLSPSTKIEQRTLSGKQYTVEQDNRGVVTRAWDENGTRQDEQALAKLNAGGLKIGGQIYGFTGEPGIVRENDGTFAEVRQRTNAQTGQIENIYVTGPKAGERYTGTQIPQAKSVSTSAQKVDYTLAADLYKKHSGNVVDMLKDYETIKGPLGEAGRQQFFQQYGYGRAVPQPSLPAPLNAAPVTPAALPQAAPAAPAPVAAAPVAPMAQPAVSARPAAPAVAPVAVGGPAVPQGGVATPIGALQTQQALTKKAGEEAITTTETVKREELKPPAEARGKVGVKNIQEQDTANRTYPVLQEINALLNKSTGSGIGAKVDDLARIIGASPEGAQTIAQLQPLAGRLVSYVPRFEGSQSDRDVIMYQKQAGDFANAALPVKERLAALQGMITLMKIYDKDGKNDWSSIAPAVSTGISAGTTKSVGGVTYEFDGKGWKKK